MNNDSLLNYHLAIKIEIICLYLLLLNEKLNFITINSGFFHTFALFKIKKRRSRSITLKKYMKLVTIEGQLRSDFGKTASRHYRSEGRVPCVIYGGSENVHFTATQKELKGVIYTAEFNKAVITVDGKTYTCILKDLQFNKTTDVVTHLDFLELVEGKRLNANVPLKFVGQSVGVKSGGRFEIKMSTIKVRTTPQYLTTSIDVDITHLEIGKNLRIEDIKVENIEIMHNKRIPVAAVVTTRALKQAENEAAKAGKK